MYALKTIETGRQYHRERPAVMEIININSLLIEVITLIEGQ
jgi:hypothetical protein